MSTLDPDKLQEIQNIAQPSKFSLQSNTDGKGDMDFSGFVAASLLNQLIDQSLFELAKGKVPGSSKFRIFGTNDNLGTTLSDVSCVGGILSWPTTASTLEAISDNTNDTAGGTGARVITVLGLDSNFNSISEDIIMSGTSASIATTNEFVRINKVVVKEAGTYASSDIGSNAGRIVVRISGGGAEQSCMPVGVAEAEDFRFTVPAGFTGFLISSSIDVEANKLTNVDIWARPFADIITAPFTPKILINSFIGLSQQVDFNLASPLRFPEKTDIWASAKIAQGTGGKVEMISSLVLIDNNFI